MADDETRELTKKPRRRRAGCLSGLVVLLLVLGGLLLAADRIGVSVAEGRLASAVTAEADARGVTADSVVVSIGGFPFLTQVARERYDEIKIDMTDARSGELTVSQLLVTAYGVKADTGAMLDGNPTADAERVTGTAVIAWAALPKLLDYAGLGVGDAKFSQAGKGVRVLGNVTIANNTLQLAATAVFSVKDGKVSVKISDAEIEGTKLAEPIQSALDDLQSKMSLPVDVPPLPFGMKIDDVTAVAEGLSVTATAKNVPIAR